MWHKYLPTMWQNTIFGIVERSQEARLHMQNLICIINKALPMMIAFPVTLLAYISIGNIHSRLHRNSLGIGTTQLYQRKCYLCSV